MKIACRSSIVVILVLQFCNTSHPSVIETSGDIQLPVYFIENQGQVEEEVAYYVQGSDKTLYFTDQGITMVLSADGLRWCTRLDFQGATSKPNGADRCDAVISYFKGEPENWRTNIPTYGRLVYPDLWPGIDLAYSGTMNRVKYDFILKPGADPSVIRMLYTGVTKVALNEDGSLEITTPAGGFKDDVPSAHQIIKGVKKSVDVGYALKKEGKGSYSYGFDVGEYNADESLVLDPAFVIFCGFIGGDDWEEGHAVAVDVQGNIYVTGETSSDESSFPVIVGPDLRYNGGNYHGDGFVAKVNAEGTALIYCGYIGGNASDTCRGIDVDSEGHAYLTGETLSKESTFPVKLGPDLTSNGLTEAFVAKVNASGTDLVYCGYIGGAFDDHGFGIAVGSDGCAYVTGRAHSDESTFPVSIGPDLVHNGNYYGDGFVAKVNAQGSGLEYCGYIGGDSWDLAYGIAVSADDRACITGITSSDETSFPVKVGPVLEHSGKFGDFDCFVARVNTPGTDLDYCGYIGGTDDDHGCGVAVDAQNRVYVTGYTHSDSDHFPLKTGPFLTFSGNYDAFVARVNEQGTDFDYCGYIGGTGDDRGHAIAVDGSNRAYITGVTRSDETTFPLKWGPSLTHMGSRDAFIARVDPSGTGIEYCGYIGGTGSDEGKGIAVDGDGHPVIIGNTTSDESSFPVKTGPDTTFNGGMEAFVIKLCAEVPLVTDTSTLPETGGTVKFNLNAGAANAGRKYILLGSVSGTRPGYPLPGGQATLPLNWDAFTDFVVALMNTPLFDRFLGKLRPGGTGDAKLIVPPIPPGHVGVVMHFAYVLNAPFDFASNPVAVEFVP